MSQLKKLFFWFRCLRSVWCLELFLWIVNRLYIYYTKLLLGFPPRDFYVHIGIGSDVLWVSCASCKGCPQTNENTSKASHVLFISDFFYLRLMCCSVCTFNWITLMQGAQ